MKSPYKTAMISPGVQDVFGTVEAERFVLSASENNADAVNIDGFEYGGDKLHYGKVNATGYEFAYIDKDGDGEENDLLITMGDQKVVLSDLGDQIPGPTEYRFFQGFETDASGINDADDGWFGSVERASSGTDGINAASGNYYAIFEQGGAAGGETGPYTFYDGPEATWQGEWTASAKIYLDSTVDGGGWAAGEGFDYSVASATSSGVHLQDFIFHVTQDTSTGDLLINASNNTSFDPREDLETEAGTATVAEDGWYTFEHRFHDDGGVLVGEMRVIADDGDVLFETSRSEGAVIPDDVGGNFYGWFTNIDVADGIAVDDISLQYSGDQVPSIPSGEDIFWT